MTTQKTPFHTVQSLSFEDDRLILKVDNLTYVCHLSTAAPQLLQASSEERLTYEISPSGYGIYWPLLDLDLFIDGLIRVGVPKAQSA